MGLSWCINCQTLEGDTEVREEETVCATCGEEITNVPEHDDYDMER